jgi:hypothetical protein
MTLHTPRHLLVAVALLAAFVRLEAAPTCLLPATAPVGARAGTSVACDGDTLAVGVPDDDAAGTASGSVYVYRRTANGWEVQGKITGPTPNGTWPDGPATYRLFGEAVAVSGSTLVIGVPLDGADTSGAAYVYVRRNGLWTLQTKLTPSDSTQDQEFGNAVAIDGNAIVVGAFSDSASADKAGAAYVFTRRASTWTERAKLTPSDINASAFFGSSVAISGLNVVVGAPTFEAAYVFAPQKNGWAQLARLTAFDELEGDFSGFGASVAINGNTAVIGAPEEGMNAVRAGAVYTFTLNGHNVQKQKLTASDGNANDTFGSCVAIEGDRVVVGAPFEHANAGAVYIFNRSAGAFSQTGKLTDAGTTDSAFLGYSVAISGRTIVAGAPAFDTFAPTPSGATYVFDVQP